MGAKRENENRYSDDKDAVKNGHRGKKEGPFPVLWALYGSICLGFGKITAGMNIFKFRMVQADGTPITWKQGVL